MCVHGFSPGLDRKAFVQSVQLRMNSVRDAVLHVVIVIGVQMVVVFPHQTTANHKNQCIEYCKILYMGSEIEQRL